MRRSSYLTLLLFTVSLGLAGPCAAGARRQQDRQNQSAAYVGSGTSADVRGHSNSA